MEEEALIGTFSLTKVISGIMPIGIEPEANRIDWCASVWMNPKGWPALDHWRVILLRSIIIQIPVTK